MRAPRCAAWFLVVLSLSACSTTPGSREVAYNGQIGYTLAVGVALLLMPDSLRRFPRRYRHGGHVSLDDAYEAVFGVHLHSPDVDPETGRVIHPNPAHLDVPPGRKTRGAGYMNGPFSDLANRYGLVPLRYAISQEVLKRGDRTYLLVSVVQHKPGTWAPIRSRPSDPMEWFLPDENTDTVLDWVAIDRTLIEDDRDDACLVAAAVQAILDHRHASDYWAVSKRWREGQFDEVMALSAQRTHAMQGDSGACGVNADIVPNRLSSKPRAAMARDPLR
jgi:hypothetical protein